LKKQSKIIYKLIFKKMKIAIATINKEENSEISNRGGRAPYYLIFNEKGELLEVFSNPFAVGGGGAGFALSQIFAEKGIDIVIAGNIGPNMAYALEEKGIKFYQKLGKAKEALQEVVG